MHDTLEDDVRRIVASMDGEQNEQEQEPLENRNSEQLHEETIHIHYFPDAIVILKEDAANQQEAAAVETTLAQTKQPPLFIAYATCLFYLLLILSCIAFQFYLVFNPPIVTVTILPRSQILTIEGTLQLGRV